MISFVAQIVVACLAVYDFSNGVVARFPIYAAILLGIELFAVLSGHLRRPTVFVPLVFCIAIVCYTRILNVYTVSFGYVAGLMIQYAGELIFGLLMAVIGGIAALFGGHSKGS